MQSNKQKKGSHWLPFSINFYDLTRFPHPFFMGLNTIFPTCLWRL